MHVSSIIFCKIETADAIGYLEVAAGAEKCTLKMLNLGARTLVPGHFSAESLHSHINSQNQF